MKTQATQCWLLPTFKRISTCSYHLRILEAKPIYNPTRDMP